MEHIQYFRIVKIIVSTLIKWNAFNTSGVKIIVSTLIKWNTFNTSG